MDSKTPLGQHGFDGNFVPDLELKYTCPVCLAALNEPIQTKCGHRFCKACLKQSTGPGRLRMTKCPVDNQWLDTAKDVFSDVATEREVLALKVKCDNHEDGCVWQGELRDLQNHLPVCPKSFVKCELCGMECMLEYLPQHLSTKCPKRLVECCHCSTKVKMCDLGIHQVLMCMKFPVNCGVCWEPGILREKVSTHTDGDCPLVEIKCKFFDIGCFFQDKRINMKQHYEHSLEHHMLLLKLKIRELDEQYTHQATEMNGIVTDFNQLFQLTNTQQSMIQFQQQILLHHASFIQDLQNTGANGRILWKIKIDDIHTKHLKSPHFFTGRPGYKLSMMLKPQGYHESSDIYASIFVCLDHGRYDEGLMFPFSGSCHISVISDRNLFLRENHACIDFTLNHKKEFCQNGIIKFMKLTDLFSARYLQGDILFLSVAIESLAI